MADKDLGLTLFNSLKGDLKQLTADMSEAVLDQGMDGIAKDIPILNTLRGLYNLTGNISNYLFTKKLLRFLAGIADIPPEKRQEFVNKMATDEKHARRVGENMLLLLERMNDIQKPDLMAKVFRAYVEGEISLDTFQQLNHAIDVINVDSIHQLKMFYAEQEIPDHIRQHLAICGLVTIEFGTGPTDWGFYVGGSFKKNELGATFLNIIKAAS